MRIAFILYAFPVLSETFILNQITGLIDRGHHVGIHSFLRESNSTIHNDIISYGLLDRTHFSAELPKNKIFRALKAIKMCRNSGQYLTGIVGSMNVLRYGREAASLRLLYSVLPWFGKQYDIIQCHFGPLGFAGLHVRELCSMSSKVVVSFHGYDMSKDLRKASVGIYKPLFEKIDCALPVSNHWRDRLVDLGCPSEKILVHHMGVDCDRFVFEPRTLRKGMPVRLVTAARLVEKKGLQFAIQAVAHLKKQGRHFEYNIVGDGPLRDECLYLIKQLGAENSINLLGRRSEEEVREILSNSHIYLQPSVTAKDGDQEGIPVGIMEAMAVGLPVVSTFHSGIPELVQNGKSGFLVPERDIISLSDRINHLAMHPEIWPEMGRAGRAFVEENHNIHKLNDRLVEIYSNLL